MQDPYIWMMCHAQPPLLDIRCTFIFPSSSCCPIRFLLIHERPPKDWRVFRAGSDKAVTAPGVARRACAPISSPRQGGVRPAHFYPLVGTKHGTLPGLHPCRWMNLVGKQNKIWGVAQVGDRHVISGIVHVIRNELTWCDAMPSTVCTRCSTTVSCIGEKLVSSICQIVSSRRGSSIPLHKRLSLREHRFCIQITARHVMPC